MVKYAGFNMANYVVAIITALDNLILATTDNHDIVSALFKTNAQLVATNEALTNQ